MAGYIGSKASVVSSGAEHKKVFDITTTTTSLTGLVYTPTLVHVFHNGVRLVDGTDYTATNGTSITLTVAAENGDQVVVISYATFQTSDTVSASAGGTFGGSVSVTGAFTSLGIDDNATSTAMTLDSSGNLLVGHTSQDFPVDNGGAGVTLRPTGVMLIGGTSTSIYANREDSDGEIVQFRKDGTTVGSIGTAGGTITIDGGGTSSGIYFGENQLVPRDNGAGSNNVVDLGQSGNSFKDLYLSGGVYLGGTGAANKLDSYEEGAFAPTFTSGSGTITTSVNVGRYVKIGNMVHCNFNIRSTGVSGISGAIGITGMPFTAHSPSRAAGSIWYMRSWGAALDNLRFGIAGNTSALSFYTQAANGTVTSLDNGDFATGGDNNVLECSITYRTT